MFTRIKISYRFTKQKNLPFIKEVMQYKMVKDHINRDHDLKLSVILIFKKKYTVTYMFRIESLRNLRNGKR